MNTSLWSISAWNGLYFIDRSKLILHLSIQWWIRISRPEMTMYLLDLFMKCLDLWSEEFLLNWRVRSELIIYSEELHSPEIVADLYTGSFQQKRAWNLGFCWSVRKEIYDIFWCITVFYQWCLHIDLCCLSTDYASSWLWLKIGCWLIFWWFNEWIDGVISFSLMYFLWA